MELDLLEMLILKMSAYEVNVLDILVTAVHLNLHPVDSHSPTTKGAYIEKGDNR